MTTTYTTEEILKMEEEAKKKAPIEREYTTEELESMEGLQAKDQEPEMEKHAKAAAAGAAKGATLGGADEIAGTLASVWAMQSGKSPQEAYKEVRDTVRNWDKEWRSKAPVAAFLTELGVAAANPALRAGGLLRTFAQAGVYGLMETDAEDLATNLIHAGISGLSGSAMQLGMRGVGGLVRNPNIIRSRTVGHKPQEFISARLHEGKPVVTDIHKGTTDLKAKGFFKGSSVKYDVLSNKWIKDKVKIPRESTRLESLHDRTRKGIDIINKEVDNLLYHATLDKKSKFYKSKDFQEDPEFMNIIEEFVGDELGPTEARKKLSKVMSSIYDTVDNVHEKGGGSTLLDLQSLKSKLQKRVQWSKEDLPPDVEAMNSFYKKMSNYFKEKVHTEVTITYPHLSKGGEPLGDYIKTRNITCSKLIDKNRALSGTLGIKDYGGKVGVDVPVGTGAWYMGKKILDETILHPDVSFGRAKIGDMMEVIPKRGRDMLRDASIQAPYKGVPKLLERPPEEGRKPQSLPDMLIDTPIKRETSEFMNNKDFVKMKVAQQAPELLPGLTVGMEGDPRMMEDILPVLPTIMPSLFEYDKYNRFDGKIMDPQMRDKATKDTMARNDLSNTEKIMIISQMNRNGEFTQ